MASQTFDHTSTLWLIETLFGVEVPNLSAWRRGITGDLTSALALAGTLDVGIPYPLPTTNSMPAQETTPARPPVPS